MLDPNFNECDISSGRPCKIVDMSTSKTGKHGHAKVHLVAIDVSQSLVPVFLCEHIFHNDQIFTGKKLVGSSAITVHFKLV